MLMGRMRLLGFLVWSFMRDDIRRWWSRYDVCCTVFTLSTVKNQF